MASSYSQFMLEYYAQVILRKFVLAVSKWKRLWLLYYILFNIFKKGWMQYASAICLPATYKVSLSFDDIESFVSWKIHYISERLVKFLWNKEETVWGGGKSTANAWSLNNDVEFHDTLMNFEITAKDFTCLKAKEIGGKKDSKILQTLLWEVGAADTRCGQLKRWRGL